ncbi:hypothetical protein BDU57DRAFT_532295 [Ampelomyces quisqualis]|uniref:Uncharacterized protein n=1 Tax=Ampelomyces quisqualis TaxID=50730 RepID=A0A6A5QD04_AMPQU|nr:hypothetical protein BDU57DRAFT_532295 [Ampelomyces quisqualis]
MQRTMDTDHGLPIPIHRPFITLDTHYDSPLPFRKHLKQTTQLSAENSTPYQIPKKRRLSSSEKLPLEVRHRIYAFTRVVNVYKAYGAEGSLRTQNGYSDITRVGNAQSLLKYPYECMLNAGPTLQFIRRIRLEQEIMPNLQAAALPHSRKVLRKQLENHLSGLATSINFIAKRCPFLIALHFSPTNRVREHPQAVASVTIALQNLVEHCPDLLVLGMIAHVRKVYIAPFMQTMEITKGSDKQDCELKLGGIAHHAREDAAVMWCNTIVREAIEYHEVLEYIPWHESLTMNGPWTEVWEFDI